MTAMPNSAADVRAHLRPLTMTSTTPDGATVAASNRLVPQLTSRTTVSEFALPGRRPVPEWIVVDTATPQGGPISRAQQARDIDAARARGYRTVIDRDGHLLLQRR